MQTGGAILLESAGESFATWPLRRIHPCIVPAVIIISTSSPTGLGTVFFLMSLAPATIIYPDLHPPVF